VCQNLKYETDFRRTRINFIQKIQKWSSEVRTQINKFLDSTKTVSGLDGEHIETNPDIEEMKTDEDSNDVRLRDTL
jgi:hypothetical protein